MNNIEVKKEQIQDLGLNAIQEFFKIDVTSLDKELIGLLHKKANLAMQFEKEMNTGKRAVEMNYIRVFRMIAEDKDEIKKLVRKHMPKYL